MFAIHTTRVTDILNDPIDYTTAQLFGVTEKDKGFNLSRPSDTNIRH